MHLSEAVTGTLQNRNMDTNRLYLQVGKAVRKSEPESVLQLPKQPEPAEITSRYCLKITALIPAIPVLMQ